MISKIEELEKIKSLKDKGSITEQEFEIEKQKILNSDNSSTTTKTTEGIYVASLVLGIFSFIFGIVPILGLILAIIGLVISIKSRKKLKINNEKKGIVTAGFVLSIVGLIISILSIILIVLGIGIAILTGDNGVLTQAERSSELSIIEEEKETSKIEIGTDYTYNSNDVIGFIRFYTETDFTMQLEYAGNEIGNIIEGNYSINGDIIELIVSYDNYAGSEEGYKLGKEKITILENGDLEYTDKFNYTYTFSKGNTNNLRNNENISTTNLLDEPQITGSTNNNNSTSNNYNSGSGKSSSSNNNYNYDTSNRNIQKEKTMTLILHKSCLIRSYTWSKTGLHNVTSIENPLNVVIKADDKTIFEDTFTSDDLSDPFREDCKTTQIKYTCKTAPNMIVFVNGEKFSDLTYQIKNYFNQDRDTSCTLVFDEH